MNISTTKLQNLVTKAIKGAGFNKLLPITGMIGITFTDSNIGFSTSDGTNYLYLRDKLDSILGDIFDVTVDADIFAKLVAKLSSDTTELTVSDNKLIVTANGIYKLPLCMSDSGEPLHYPALDKDEAETSAILGKLSPAVISTIISTLKPTLSSNVSTPYANYLFTDYVVSTDRTMLNAYMTDERLLSQDMLFSREFVDLLGLADCDVEIRQSNYLVADAGDMMIYSKANTDATDFNKKGTQAMLDMQYDSYCKLKKSALVPLLERISLFVGDYGATAIRLNFNEQGLEVTSNSDAGAELIEYMESKDFKETSIKIDVNKFLTQLKAYQSDAIDLYYGNKMSIRLKDGDVIQVIALIA